MSIRLRDVIPWALLVLAMALLGIQQRCHDRHTAADAVAAHELARLRADSARLARRGDSLRVVYVRDTVRLRTVRRETDTLVLRDSLIVRDTVVRWLERERAACDLVISRCEARLAVADSQTARADSAARLWRGLAERQKCRLLFIPCPSRTVMFVGGVVVGAVGVSALRR